VREVKEVLDIAAKLTPEELKIARFWVDGSGSVTPPGHWNQIAIEEVLKANLNDKQTARLFVQLNIALADVFIAVWDTKYHYWTMRPVTAARNLFGADFKSTILTPPFPSYVSGHAGFSGAGARILGAHFPARRIIFDTLAEEAANSRLLGGIHFRHDNEDGLVLGRNVAQKVLNRLNR
jgi:membrane-associated phospholipid phosphatase